MSPDQPCAGKIVLVTGAQRGIGRAIALRFAAAGADVALNFLDDKAAAESTAAQIVALGRRATTLAADIARPEEARYLVAEAEGVLGPLDVVVNNAAIFPRAPFLEVTEADWDQVMAINLKAPFFLAQAAARPMLVQGAGKIVNLADISAERPWTGYLPYCLSKAGIVAMTRGLARALAPAIQVTAVAPGAVLFPEGTPDEERERLLKQIPLGREGEPSDVARTVRFLIEGSDYITGVVVPVDGGRSVAG